MLLRCSSSIFLISSFPSLILSFFSAFSLLHVLGLLMYLLNVWGPSCGFELLFWFWLFFWKYNSHSSLYYHTHVIYVRSLLWLNKTLTFRLHFVSKRLLLFFLSTALIDVIKIQSRFTGLSSLRQKVSSFSLTDHQCFAIKFDCFMSFTGQFYESILLYVYQLCILTWW